MYSYFSKSQKLSVDKIAEGRNVFITGPAGTGKSFLLNNIKDEYKSAGLHITASTGISAVNIGGQTLHSWAGLGLGVLPLNEIARFILSTKGIAVRKRLIGAKMLAIDEISMISGDIFDLLNNLLKIIRQSDKPFGGVQMILFGDFLQLPPVNKTGSDNLFCFESNAWQEAQIETIVLKDVYRQTNRRFVELLNNLRFGTVTEDDMKILTARFQSDSSDSASDATILGTHNAQVEQINAKKLKELQTPGKTYTATFEGKANKIEFLKKNCIAPEQLSIKIGAQVMMLKNTFVSQGIINGSVGIVREFSSKKSYPVVEFSNGSLITIAPEEWCIEKFNENTGQVEVEAKMAQIPLILAWAITVHKSQGMTLDKIKCDLSGAFAEGQIYVALSRVKDLEGLFINSFNVASIRANNRIVEFYRQYSDV